VTFIQHFTAHQSNNTGCPTHYRTLPLL